MLYSKTLAQSARALRTAVPITKTSFTKFQTLKGHVRTHTTKNARTDPKTGKINSDKSRFESGNTWKDTLIGVFGTAGALTVGTIFNTFLAKALDPQLRAHEARANQAAAFYVHGY